MAIEWATVARAAMQGYKHRHLIQEYWTKLLAKIDMGSTDIVVTGHSAAGKSYLVSQLHGRAREIFFEEPKESIKTEVEAVTIGEWTQLIRVLPGQLGRRVSGEIKSIDDNVKLNGIIHVVDFGFVAPRDLTQARLLVETDNIDTTDKLREHNLKLEIHDLDMLINSILKSRKKHGMPNWLVIVVNKIDLFKNNLDKALLHYHPDGSGEFGKRLKKLQSELGSSSFGVHILPACANETDFSWNGETTNSALNKNEQEEILRTLVTSLARIMEEHS
ncbi:GTPase domain-containing protein [Chromobacterium haemolyticum]|uniref:GTPase domain-containing protein n=1 Tax=Chromobacterium haemolyticum TaxID=394935 RepID=UPI0017474C9C|nr:GTPase domain-containing protein [Chromobacterium haemolyticum]QOD82208.1 GTPase domain-containing protein [Chromobacterium haemolyticum]